MDHFGIGNGVDSAVRIYFQSARRSGRTTSLVESLKTGDRVVFSTQKEARRVLSLCKERDVVIEAIVCDPESPERLFHRGSPSDASRTVFDHGWVEQFYFNAIERARADIDAFQRNLSGRSLPHREAQRDYWGVSPAQNLPTGTPRPPKK
jgi:hypothetical protein